jgi:cell wall-associated NlpC family hydrolase
MLRDDIVDAARRYLGTPYVHQGRSAWGLDCIGLVLRVAHDLELSEYNIDGYARVPSGRMMVRLLTQECTPIRANEAKAGDVIHMAFDRQPQHLAVLSDKGMIHADNVRGVVEHRLDDQWRARIRGWYRLPGVTD